MTRLLLDTNVISEATKLVPATALAHDCTIVTVNELDFRAVVALVNPLHHPP